MSTRNLRNLTVTVEDGVARWARIWATRHNTSVSRLVGDLLRVRMQEDEGYEVAMHAYLAAKPTRLKRSGGYPRRDERHDRPRVR